MFWIIAVVIVLIVVFAASQANQKTEEIQKREEFNALAQSRVSAYADFLKRTGPSPAIAAMTDNEIRDFIQHNIREYATERKGLEVMTVFLAIIGVAGGIILALVQKSFEPLILVVMTTIGVAMMVHKIFGRQMTRKYTKRGLDVEKLKIET